MAERKAYSKSQFNKLMRAQIKWVKKPGMSTRSTQYLYFHGEKVGEITNSTYSGNWMYQLYKPHESKYVSNYQAARKGLIKASGLSKYYEK